MNNRTDFVRRSRDVWPWSARAAVVIIATAVLALSAAACNGGPSSSGSNGSRAANGSANSKALAYASCMRSHGVPNFPDPGSSGDFDKTTLQRLTRSSPRYQTANHACGRLLPAGGPTAAEVQQEWSGMASFARCMRSHGVPNWPDPTPYPPYPNEPTFDLPASVQPVPRTISTMDECLRMVPHNEVVGHIENDNWRAAQQAMAGQ